MALSDIGKAINDGARGPLFLSVVGACVKAAADIINESPATPEHENRVKWADRVNHNGIGMGGEMFSYVMRDATFLAAVETGAAITDAQIRTAVNGSINDLATGA